LRTVVFSGEVTGGLAEWLRDVGGGLLATPEGGTAMYGFGGGGAVLELLTPPPPPPNEVCFARAALEGGMEELEMTDVDRLFARSDALGFACAVLAGGCLT
jgi:hypothetical protein